MSHELLRRLRAERAREKRQLDDCPPSSAWYRRHQRRLLELDESIAEATKQLSAQSRSRHRAAG